MQLIAEGIRILHVVLILFIVLLPLIEVDELLLLLHIVTIISLIIHWKTNNDICILTLIEGYFRGIPYKKGFLQQLIGPVYNFESSGLVYQVIVCFLIHSSIRFYNQNGFVSIIKKIYHTD